MAPEHTAEAHEPRQAINIEAKRVARKKASAEPNAQQLLLKRTAAVRSELMKLSRKGWTPGEIAALTKSENFPQPLEHIAIYHILEGHIPRKIVTIEQLEAALPLLKRLGSREATVRAALDHVLAGRKAKSFRLSNWRETKGFGQTESFITVAATTAGFMLLFPAIRPWASSILAGSGLAILAGFWVVEMQGKIRASSTRPEPIRRLLHSA